MLKGGAHVARRMHFKPCLSKAFKRISSNKWGDSFSGKAPCWSASLCQADSTPKSLTWTDNRKNLEVQRHCDLLKVTKVFTGRVQTWPGVPQKTPLPKVHGEHSLSEWILASLVISQGQLCTPGSEGLPWTLSGCTVQGHRVGLNWACGCFLFGLHSVYFNLLPKKIYNVERTVS